MILYELVKFTLTGILATIIHTSVAIYASYYGDYNILKANTLGFISALCVSFFLNAKWTFKKNFKWQQLIRFSVIATITYIVIYLISWHSEENNINAIYSIFLIALVIPIINFLMHKFWTFIK